MNDYGSGGSYTVVMNGPFAGAGGGSAEKLTRITALAENWKGAKSPYSQVVTVDGVNLNSKVEIQFDIDQLNYFYNKDIAFMAENSGGVVTLFAVGDKPEVDCNFQATLSDVVSVGNTNGSVIRGNTLTANTPRTDATQTDPTRSDYLVGREHIISRDLLATLSVSGWSSAKPYSQTVVIENDTGTPFLRPEDYPIADIILNNAEDPDAVIEAWGMVGRIAIFANDKITAYCYEDRPEVDIPIVVKVVR